MLINFDEFLPFPLIPVGIQATEFIKGTATNDIMQWDSTQWNFIDGNKFNRVSMIDYGGSTPTALEGLLYKKPMLNSLYWNTLTGGELDLTSGGSNTIGGPTTTITNSIMKWNGISGTLAGISIITLNAGVFSVLNTNSYLECLDVRQNAVPIFDIDSSVRIGVDASSLGLRNTSIGYEALTANTTGTDNIAVGYQSLSSTTGSNNIGIGTGSNAVVGGSSNITIGNNITLSAAAVNRVVIGVDGTSSVNNSFTIADSITSFKMSSLAVGITDTVVGYDNGTMCKIATSAVNGINASNITQGTLTKNVGGTGQTTYNNGELLIGNTTGNTLTKATLTGTANRITVTNGSGSITLSTPQNIQSGAAPIFLGTNMTGLALTTAVSGILQILNGGTEASAYLDGQLLIGSATGTLTKANLTGTANQLLVSNGNGSITLSTPQNIQSGAAPIFLGTSFSGISLSSAVIGVLPTINGGTGHTTYENGEILIGNALGTLTKATLTGTANRITVTNGPGSITLSTPQDIATTSSPTFLGTNITSLSASNVTTGTLAVANGGTGQTTYITNGQLLIGNTTGNTLTKATITGTANRVIVTNASGSITLSTPQDIGTSSSPTFLGTNITGLQADRVYSGKLAVINGGTGQSYQYTDGQLLIGNSTGGTLTKTTLTGAANRITVINGPGSITLSTPQDINVGASPTFLGTNITSLSASNMSSGILSIAQGGTEYTTYTANQILIGNGSATLTAKTLSGTTNQIIIDQDATTITLKTPQSIATTSTTTFGQVYTTNLVGLNMSYSGAINSINDCPTMQIVNNRSSVAWPINSAQKTHRILFNLQDSGFIDLIGEIYMTPITASASENKMIFIEKNAEVFSLTNKLATMPKSLRVNSSGSIPNYTLGAIKCGINTTSDVKCVVNDIAVLSIQSALMQSTQPLSAPSLYINNALSTVCLSKWYLDDTNPGQQTMIIDSESGEAHTRMCYPRAFRLTGISASAAVMANNYTFATVQINIGGVNNAVFLTFDKSNGNTSTMDLPISYDLPANTSFYITIATQYVLDVQLWLFGSPM